MRNKHFSIAFESDEITSADDSAETNLAMIAADAGELSGEADEIENNAVELDETADAMDELGEVVDTAEASNITDDNAAAAATFEMAVESIMSRIGVQTRGMALEDASGVTATISQKIKAAKDLIVRLFRAFIAALRSAYVAVKVFFKKLFASTKKIDSTVDVLIKRAKAVRGASVRGGDLESAIIENKRLVEALAVSGDRRAFLKSFQTLQDIADYSASTAGPSGVLNKIASYVKLAEFHAAEQKLGERIVDALEEGFTHSFPKGSELPSAGNHLVSSLLPGNKVVMIYVPENEDEIRDFDFKIVSAQELKASFEQPNFLRMVDSADTIRILNHISAANKKLSEVAKVDYESVIKGLEATADKLLRSSGDFELSANQRRVLSSVNAITQQLMNSTTTVVARQLTSTCSYALIYCAENINLLKKKLSEQS